MVVPHGDDHEEWLTCLGALLYIAGPHTVGISKFELHTPRLTLVQSVVHVNHIRRRAGLPQVDIHLLGMSERICDWRIAGAHSLLRYVRGIDSGLPIFFTANGETMGDMSSRPQIEVDLMEAELDRNLLQTNVWIWKGMASRLGEAGRSDGGEFRPEDIARRRLL